LSRSCFLFSLCSNLYWDPQNADTLIFLTSLLPRHSRLPWGRFSIWPGDPRAFPLTLVCELLPPNVLCFSAPFSPMALLTPTYIFFLLFSHLCTPRFHFVFTRSCPLFLLDLFQLPPKGRSFVSIPLREFQMAFPHCMAVFLCCINSRNFLLFRVPEKRGLPHKPPAPRIPNTLIEPLPVVEVLVCDGMFFHDESCHLSHFYGSSRGSLPTFLHSYYLL